jgi:metal-sulfur cluster biosynthetic enzyme
MFIQTETTNNPAILKFLPGRQVLDAGTLDINDRAQAAISPLAKRLFDISGVSAVSFDSDSITITRTGSDWRFLKPVILGAIMDHFLSGEAVLRREAAGHGPGSDSLDPSGGADDAMDRFREALRHVIDPELGYNIVDLGLIYNVALRESGTVTVTMTTTTPGCPATGYLRQGAINSVSQVPGVRVVEVELTYEPRWTPEMMSPEAKAHFGISDGSGW